MGQVGLNVADWTIIGPGYAKVYAAAGVDVMAVMTPTYSENRRNWPYMTNLVATLGSPAAVDMAGETVIFHDTPLFLPIETPSKCIEGCSRMTVSLTAT